MQSRSLEIHWFLIFYRFFFLNYLEITFMSKAYKDDSLFEANVSIEDLQKKIIPWHCLMPRQEDLENLHKSKSSTENGGLILVGSLIDKGTNLGGICRTCEIFNVKELTLSSIRLVEDKTFQQLSVTSEKWLNIKEVCSLTKVVNI